MLADVPSVGRGVGDDHPSADAVRTRQAPFRRDPGGESRRPVERPDQLLDVHDLGLELDDKDGSARAVPREDVDDPALAVDREGDLWPSAPLGKRREPTRHSPMQRRVTLVEKPRQLTAAPPGKQVQPDVERGSDYAQQAQGTTLQMSPLHLGHDGPGDSSPRRNIGLAPPPPQADRTQRGSDYLILHASSWRALLHSRSTVTWQQPVSRGWPLILSGQQPVAALLPTRG